MYLLFLFINKMYLNNAIADQFSRNYIDFLGYYAHCNRFLHFSQSHLDNFHHVNKKNKKKKLKITEKVTSLMEKKTTEPLTIGQVFSDRNRFRISVKCINFK